MILTYKIMWSYLVFIINKNIPLNLYAKITLKKQSFLITVKFQKFK